MAQPCKHRLPDINACALCRRELATNPTMDVRELYDSTPPAPTHTLGRGGWRALVAAHERDEQRRAAAEAARTATLW